jgi:NitT/TauT family transport system permease protein
LTGGASLVAFAVSVVLGTVIAILLSRSAWLRRVFFPLLVALQAAPKIALAPLLVVWVGFGREMAITIGIVVAVFPMIINAMAGLTTVDTDVIMMAKAMKATKNQIFTRIELPYALPHLVSGMKTTLVLAVVGVVIGELTGANSGLGYILVSQSAQFNMSYAFAAMLILMGVGVVLFYILEWLETMTAWYAADARRTELAQLPGPAADVK